MPAACPAVALVLLTVVLGWPFSAHAAEADAARPDAGSLYAKALSCRDGKIGNPPCIEYDRAGEYVLLRDRARSKQYACLIVPVITVRGIEDERTINNEKVRDLWRAAWENRETCFKNVPAPAHGEPEPAARIGLAVNSLTARSENQLHIHISCLSSAAKRVIDEKSASFNASRWTPVTIDRHTWYARKLASLAGGRSPFEVVWSHASSDVKANNYIGRHSVVVVAARSGPGYYVLDGYREGGQKASGEEMLDQMCGH